MRPPLRRLAVLAAAVLLLLTLGAPPVRAQPFDVGRTLGGASSDIGEAVAVDALGALYVAGTFEGTIDFGGGVTLTSAGDADAFLARFDAVGNAVWARRGGTSAFNDFGRDVVVDGLGAVYVAGFFAGVGNPATFDGGANPDVTVGPANGFDAFVAKYDANGDLQWVQRNDSAQQTSGSTQDTGRSLALDPDGTGVYLAGDFQSTIGWDAQTITSAGSTDAYLVKLDAATGAVQWVRTGGGTESDAGYGVAVAAGGVTFGGEFEGVATFGGAPLASRGEDDVFVARYDDAGTLLWLAQVGGSQDDFCRGVAADDAGAAYVGGAFEGSLLVGQDVLTSAGFTDVFVAKLDGTGAAVWGRRGGGDAFDFGQGLAADGQGVYLTGYVDSESSADVTFGPDDVVVPGRGFTDGFVAAYRPNGVQRTVEVLGGSNQDEGNGIATSPSGDVVGVTGAYRGTATLGSGGGPTVTSNGSNDAFLARAPAADLPVELASFTAQAAPGALRLAWATASETANAGFHVEHAAPGAAGFADAGFVAGAGTTTAPQTYAFRLTGLAPGAHRVRLRQVDLDGTATRSDVLTVEIGLAAAVALSAVAPQPLAAGARAQATLTVAQAQDVRAAVYDVLGRRVAVLHDGPVAAGQALPLRLHADGWPSGAYLLRVTGPHAHVTRRFTVVR